MLFDLIEYMDDFHELERMAREISPSDRPRKPADAYKKYNIKTHRGGSRTHTGRYPRRRVREHTAATGM